MAKVTKKETVGGVPAGMTSKDLSLEKRVELYSTAFEEFKAKMVEEFGLALEVELLTTPRAIVPRLTLVDLQKKNEQNQKTGNAEAKK